MSEWAPSLSVFGFACGFLYMIWEWSCSLLANALFLVSQSLSPSHTLSGVCVAGAWFHEQLLRLRGCSCSFCCSLARLMVGLLPRPWALEKLELPWESPHGFPTGKEASTLTPMVLGGTIPQTHKSCLEKSYTHLISFLKIVLMLFKLYFTN